MPHFQIVTTDGDVLGTRELGLARLAPGSVIYTEPGEPNLCVVDLLAPAASCRGYESGG